MFKKLTLAAAIAACSTQLWAHGFTVGELEIGHPYAFETPAIAMAGAGYLTITNNGDTPDRLIDVRADFPRVSIHETVVTDGVGQMLPVESIEILPGETVTLQPGGYHVMFMGLEGRQFVDGESFTGTLVFEQAGEVEVEFAVETRSAEDEAGMDHSNH